MNIQYVFNLLMRFLIDSSWWWWGNILIELYKCIRDREELIICICCDSHQECALVFSSKKGTIN